MIGHLYTLLFAGAATAPAVAGASSGGKARRRRYVARIGGKLMIFGSQALALSMIEAQDVPNRTAPEIVPVADIPEDVQQIELPQVKAYAKATGVIQQYNEAYNSRHYQALIALFEQMRDEEDVELLLMHA